MSKFIIKKEYTKQDIISLLKMTDKKAVKDLYDFANEIKKKYLGNIVHIRAILEFSNYCCRNCLYCGIRKSNDKVKRYRIEPDEIIKYALNAESAGFKTIILQSGEDFYYTVEKLEQIIKTIKSRTNLKITLSIGERQEIEYKKLKHAGADRFLLKHETSDPVLYKNLHPDCEAEVKKSEFPDLPENRLFVTHSDMNYSNRLNCLKILKSLLYETGSGIMVGLPGQTIESIANDILLFKDFNIDMMGIGPYLPHPDTPLAKKFNETGGYFIPAIGYFDVEELIYKIIAITRIVTKKTNIPATTGFNTLNDGNIREKALKRGANVIMINITDNHLRKFYEIYPTKKELAQRNSETPQELSKSLPEFELL